MKIRTQAYRVLECMTDFELSELNEYNECFMVGDDLMAEVSTKKCGRPNMEDRVKKWSMKLVQCAP